MNTLTRLFLAIIVMSLLWGCASTPPPPPEPRGPVMSINHYHPVTGEAMKNAESL